MKKVGNLLMLQRMKNWKRWMGSKRYDKAQSSKKPKQKQMDILLQQDVIYYSFRTKWMGEKEYSDTRVNN